MRVRWPFSKTYQEICPDGTIKTVYYNVDNAFPLYIPGWRGKININLNGLKELSTSLNAEYTKKIQGLLYNVNEINTSLMFMFRGAYQLYKTDPCSEWIVFERQVSRIINELHRLQLLKIQIQCLINLAKIYTSDQKEIVKLYKEIVNKIGCIDTKDLAKEEIIELRGIAIKWRGDPHEQ